MAVEKTSEILTFYKKCWQFKIIEIDAYENVLKINKIKKNH